MLEDGYLIGNVGSAEYEALQSEREGIIARVVEGFNDYWKPKVQGIETTFKYQPDKCTVGIWVKRRGDEHLAMDDEGLSEEEKAVVGSMYLRLHERLRKLRLPNETWV
jgi:nuclear transport factor 2 (NTF2) superfamily protein